MYDVAFHFCKIFTFKVLSSPSEPNAAPDLIGETEIPLSEVAPTTILIDSLDDSRRYSCTWMPLRLVRNRTEKSFIGGLYSQRL